MTGSDTSPLVPERFSTLQRLATDPDHKLVVSLGGGSLVGLCGNLALCGMLEELGLRQHVAEVWGTSAGAVVGGGWATGTPAREILGLVRGLGRRRALDPVLWRFGARILLGVWPFRRPLPDGVIRGRRFRAAIDAGLRTEAIEDCEIPFRCIACSDDGRATRKVFRRGPMVPAIFASMSLPGIVVPEPGDEDGNYYYDGGLLEKTPLISPIAEHGRSGDPRKLLLLCTHFGGTTSPGRTRGFVRRFLTALDVLEDLCWSYQLEEARARENVVLVNLNPRLRGYAMFDFAETPRCHDAARQAFIDRLQNAKIAQTFGMP